MKGSVVYSCARRIWIYHLVLPCEAKNQKREKNTHQKNFSTLYTFWILGGNIAKVNKKKSLGKNFFHVTTSQLQTWIGLSVLKVNKPKRWINPQKRNMLTLCSWSEKQHARECRIVYDIQGKNERKNPLYFQGNWSKYWKFSERNKASCCVLDLETDRSTFNLTQSFCKTLQEKNCELSQITKIVLNFTVCNKNTELGEINRKTQHVKFKFR